MAVVIDGTKGVSASGGLYAANTFTGTYTDGIVVDYTTGNGRISVGAADGITFYNNGIANNSLLSISSAGTSTFGGLLNLGSTGQIQFPATQNASGNANTLDDYEEGTWTPNFGYSGGNGNGSWTYDNATTYGWYTKIGNYVFFRMDLRFATFIKGTATGTPQITGLPYPGQNNSGYGGANFFIEPYNWAFSSQPFGVIPANGSAVLYLLRLVSSGPAVDLNDPTAGSIMIISGSYQTT